MPESLPARASGRASSRAKPRAADSLGALEQLVERLAASAAPGEEVEVYASRYSETSVRVFEGCVESLTVAQGEGIGVRVIAEGGRVGFASAGALEDEMVSQVLSQARENAALASVDPNAGLAEPDGTAAADLKVWSEEVLSWPPEQKASLALELDRMVRGLDARVRQVPSVDYGDVWSESAVATSTGMHASKRRSVAELSAMVLSGEIDAAQAGVGFSAGRSPGALDLEEAARDSVERSVRLLGAKKAPSQEVVAVFDPRVTAALLGILAGTLSGDALAKGRSLFAGRSGEAVASAELTLVDDPTIPEAFGASAYDAEGLACRRNVLIEGGALRSFLNNTYTGRILGVPSSASAIRGGYASTPGTGARALYLHPGDLAFPELLAAVGDGFYVQSVTGVHSGVNPVSGDFSVGAEGLMIRGGELADPVREVTIASTIQRMLQSVVAIGNDTRWLPGSTAGLTLAIGPMRMAGL